MRSILLDLLSARRHVAVVPGLEQLILSTAGFLFLVIYARMTSPQEVQNLAMLQLQFLFVGVLQTALLTTPLMSLPCCPASLRAAKKLALMLALGAGLSSLVLTLVLNRDIVLGLLMSLTLAGLVDRDFQRRRLFRVGLASAAISNTVIFSISQILTLSLLLMLREASGAQLALVAYASSTLLAGIHARWATRNAVSARGAIDDDAPVDIGDYIDFGKWQVGSALLYWLQNALPILVGGVILSPGAVAGIRLAQSAIGVVGTFVQAMENWQPMLLVRVLKSQGRDAMTDLARRSSLRYAAAAAPFCTLLALLGRPLIEIVYGPNYPSASVALAGYAVGLVFIFAASPLQAAIRAGGNTREILMVNLATTSIAGMAVIPAMLSLDILGVAILYALLPGVSCLGYRIALRKGNGT